VELQEIGHHEGSSARDDFCADNNEQPRESVVVLASPVKYCVFALKSVVQVNRQDYH